MRSSTTWADQSESPPPIQYYNLTRPGKSHVWEVLEREQTRRRSYSFRMIILCIVKLSVVAGLSSLFRTVSQVP